MIGENRWEILKSEWERFEISRKKKLTGKNKMQDVLTKEKIEANLWFVCRISTLPMFWALFHLQSGYEILLMPPWSFEKQF